VGVLGAMDVVTDRTVGVQTRRRGGWHPCDLYTGGGSTASDVRAQNLRELAWRWGPCMPIVLLREVFQAAAWPHVSSHAAYNDLDLASTSAPHGRRFMFYVDGKDSPLTLMLFTLYVLARL